MASIIIVTKQCYLICEAINYIVINECDDEDDDDRIFTISRNRRRRKVKKPTRRELELLQQKQYQILIEFVPVNGQVPNNSRSNGNGTCSVAIKVTGNERCLELFSHMVDQIREQIPDHMFLDRMVERFLTGETEQPQK